MLVQDSVYDDFVNKLSAAMNKELTVGDGFDKNTTQGPLINIKAVEKVQHKQYKWYNCKFKSLFN